MVKYANYLINIPIDIDENSRKLKKNRDVGNFVKVSMGAKIRNRFYILLMFTICNYFFFNLNIFLNTIFNKLAYWTI